MHAVHAYIQSCSIILLSLLSLLCSCCYNIIIIVLNCIDIKLRYDYIISGNRKFITHSKIKRVSKIAREIVLLLKMAIPKTEPFARFIFR